LKPWGAYKISGLAYNPLPNLTPDPATGVVSHAVTALLLMPLDLTPLDNPPTTMWTNLVATNAKPTGEFVLSNVDPGDTNSMRWHWTSRIAAFGLAICASKFATRISPASRSRSARRHSEGRNHLLGPRRRCGEAGASASPATGNGNVATAGGQRAGCRSGE
jgi:hypothetical protein